MLYLLFQTNEGGARDGICPNHPHVLGLLAPYPRLKDGETKRVKHLWMMESSVVHSTGEPNKFII